MMQRQSSRYDDIINMIKEKQIDAVQRSISIKSESISVIYIKELSDVAAISEYILKPLVAQKDEMTLTAADALSIICAYECTLETDDKNIINHIINGKSVVLFSTNADYLVVDTKKIEKRDIPVPEFTYSMRGPRDSLIENIESNLSLIRYRIKDEALKINKMEVGKRTKTNIAVLYIEDVANDTCVKEIIKRISAINIDGLISSGELQAFLQNKQSDLFPVMGIIERSDMACGALLEGKVVVIMDGSPWALVAPKVFSEYLWSSDDVYLNKYLTMFLRVLRVLSLGLSFIVSSLYVAIVSFHNDVLPASYMIAIAQSRAKVPFDALMEVILIELIGELIRESLVRVPSKIGTAIGIVGAIIIGQAAVVAGVFSPLLLIVISLNLIVSFIPADYTIVDPFRVLKFLLIIASGTFGFHGFTLVIVLVLSQLVSINTFGVPYMAPAAPFHFKDFLKSIIYSKANSPFRPHFLRDKDPTRAPRNKK